MVKIAIVQGRLSTQVGSKYQYFPIHSWRQEFAKAAKIGFDGIEWIVSDFSNPLFDIVTLDQIVELIHYTGVSVTSISLDVLMYNPISQLSWEDINWLFKKISFAVAKLNIQRISIPIEENSGIRNNQDAEKVVNRLLKIEKEFGNSIPLISIETDLSPLNIRHLIDKSGLNKIGLLLDIGNTAANGYLIDDYFRLLKKRIYGLHIKDREPLFQPNCSLGKGSGSIDIVMDRLKELPNLADITLQSFRTRGRYLKNAQSAFSYIEEMNK